MPTLENVATAAFTVLAFTLALVAARAWWRTRSVRVLWLALGFLLFFAKGLYVAFALFREPDWERTVFLPSLLLDLAVLTVFYAAVLHRPVPGRPAPP